MKNKKIGKFGFSKRELSNVNVDTIREKCFEHKFNEDKYNEWFIRIEK